MTQLQIDCYFFFVHQQNKRIVLTQALQTVFLPLNFHNIKAAIVVKSKSGLCKSARVCTIFFSDEESF